MTTEQILENYDPIPYAGCWIWKGSRDLRGYGTVRYHGRMHRASRVMYQLHYGIDPGSMHVCHHCDTPSCINPDHLFLGTRNDNLRDAVEKGRIARGENNGRAKLTEENVKHIRQLLLKGLSQTKIARRYGVSQGAIERIHLGKLWGWLK